MTTSNEKIVSDITIAWIAKQSDGVTPEQIANAYKIFYKAVENPNANR